MSDPTLYRSAAQVFRHNPGQLKAYDSQGHCVVLAGPGSGKTKMLTVKLARLLSENILEPRGVACITYNNECARELETQLAALGIQPSSRVFIGTVHSFSLTQIVIPYAKPAGLNLPVDFQIASASQRSAAMQRAYDRAIGGRDDPHKVWRNPMEKYRRSIIDRNSEQWCTQDKILAHLVETYECELRWNGLIDFGDMPLLALQALIHNDWVRNAILAKFPVLAIDEYQDLGCVLHRMVQILCFTMGIRLFAVGDADQSIYGFTGADPELLQQLSKREDVETIMLPFNYRCGSKIISASEIALGEERGYQAPDGSPDGMIYFHSLCHKYTDHAEYLFKDVLPVVMHRIPDLELGQIAVLYNAASVGDAVAKAAKNHGFETIRTDRNALYPRNSRIMRWIELCAIWSCGGWQTGIPRFSKLISEAVRLFSDVLITDDDKVSFQRSLVNYLWNEQNAEKGVYEWLKELANRILNDIFDASHQLSAEADDVNAFLAKLSPGGVAEGMTLGQFSGQGHGINQITLSTIHSAKGREFRVVILFGMDDGRVPRSNAKEQELRESRRLFYVGFTRVKEELHIMYTRRTPSPFVSEVMKKLKVNA